MCIALYKPAGKVITEEVLLNCYTSNRDGAGFAYIEPAKVAPHFLEEPEICIEKGYFDFEKFLEAYRPHQEKACLIHFRVATHKNVDGKNCHPWRVNEDLVFIHNGTINCLPSEGSDDNFSDTGNFNAQILQPLIQEFPTFYQTDQFKWLVQNSITSNNKLAFLDKFGNKFIVHEDQGKWDQGVWFSNTTYKPWDYKGKITTDQPDPVPEPVKVAPVNKPVEKPDNKDNFDDSKIDPDDALNIEDFQAQIEKDGGEVKFFNTIEELDAALDTLNAERLVKTS